MSKLLRIGVLSLITSSIAWDTCFSAVNSLAPYDKLLGEAPANPNRTRLIQKRNAATSSDSTTDDFVEHMRAQRSQGTGYSCQYTASWVAEVFTGLSNQFPRYRLGDYGDEKTPNVKSGYQAASGQDLIDLFTRYTTIDDRVVFELVHSPPLYHVIIVEQLPSQGGYRVYQSYNSAHALSAWLSPRSTNLSKLFDNGDIMVNPKLAATFNGTIHQLFGPTYNVDNYMSLPDNAHPIVPTLKAFMNYYLNQNTRDATLTNFRHTKEQYGEGAIISKSRFFETYLTKLAALSGFLTQSWGTNTIIPQYAADYWVDLHAVPWIMLYPGIPLNLVPNLVGITSQYYFQVRPVVVPDDIQCILNRNILAWSLLAPGRREAATLGLEDLIDAPQPSSALRLTTGGIAGIIVAASISMGIIMVAALRKRLHHARIQKPVEMDFEIVASTPSV